MKNKTLILVTLAILLLSGCSKPIDECYTCHKTYTTWTLGMPMPSVSETDVIVCEEYIESYEYQHTGSSTLIEDGVVTNVVIMTCNCVPNN